MMQLSMRSWFRPAATACAIALASCTPEAPLAPAPSIEEATFAASLGINLASMTKTADGLYYLDTPAGTGTEATATSHVTVHYTGYFTNGTSFDTSIGKAAFPVQIGAGAVIQGWEKGLVGMRVGGTRKLIVPPALGYGAAQYQDIPPNSILVFTIQLVSIP